MSRTCVERGSGLSMLGGKVKQEAFVAGEPGPATPPGTGYGLRRRRLTGVSDTPSLEQFRFLPCAGQDAKRTLVKTKSSNSGAEMNVTRRGNTRRIHEAGFDQTHDDDKAATVK